MSRHPTKLATKLGRINSVTSIVARTVGDPVEIFRVLAHCLQYHAKNGDVVPLAISTDETRLSNPALRKYFPYCRRVILGVDPVANVVAQPVKLGSLSIDNIPPQALLR